MEARATIGWECTWQLTGTSTLKSIGIAKALMASFSTLCPRAVRSLAGEADVATQVSRLEPRSDGLGVGTLDV